MNEQIFFSRIAARLGRPSPLQKTPVRAATEVGAPAFWREAQNEAGADSADRFQEELEVLGGEVKRVDSGTQLREALSSLLRELQPGCLGLWGEDFSARYGLREVLRPYDTVLWDTDGPAEFTRVHAVLTGCAYAVADSGTIVLMSDRRQGRSVALLPAVHLVIVHRSQIRLRLCDVLDELSAHRDDLPSYVHFITGPSRSSDIENDQTVGIHGPAAVIALLVP